MRSFHRRCRVMSFHLMMQGEVTSQDDGGVRTFHMMMQGEVISQDDAD